MMYHHLTQVYLLVLDDYYAYKEVYPLFDSWVLSYSSSIEWFCDPWWKTVGFICFVSSQWGNLQCLFSQAVYTYFWFLGSFFKFSLWSLFCWMGDRTMSTKRHSKVVNETQSNKRWEVIDNYDCPHLERAWHKQSWTTYYI